MSGLGHRVGSALFLVFLLAGCSEGRARTTTTSDADASPAPVAASSPAQPTSPRVVFTAPTGPSAIVLAHSNGKLYAIIADEDARALTIVRAGEVAGEPTRTIDLDGGPARVAVGKFLYATLRDRSRVVAYAMHEDGTAEKVAEAVTSSDPFGLAVSPDGQSVFVTTAFGNTFEAFDATTLKPLFSKAIAREPRSIAISVDGARAFVSHAIGSTLSVIDLVAHEKDVREISLDVKEERLDFGIPGNSWALPAGPGSNQHGPPMTVTFPRKATQGFELARVGNEILLPEALAFPGDGSWPPSGYGDSESSLHTIVPHVAHVAIDSETLTTKFISGPENRACYESDHTPQCTLPTAVATLGDAIYVACAGADMVIEHRLGVAYDESPKCFNARAKQRKFSIGKGARGIAIDKDSKHAFVWSAFDRTLRELDLGARDTRDAGAATVAVDPIPLRSAEVPLTDDARLGRELFYASADPRISNDGRACASCHPDGRQDGLVWPTPKGKRQTPMLAGRAKDSAPYDWNGANQSLPLHIAQTTKNLHGTGLGETERAALAAYIRAMDGPQREPAKSDDHVTRGRAIFESESAQCSSCHPHEGAFTDHNTHAFTRGSEAFDTPSLRFVSGTAPYFHDGRYASLEDLVEKCDGVMGRTKQLDADQKTDLVAYLRSL